MACVGRAVMVRMLWVACVGHTTVVAKLEWQSTVLGLANIFRCPVHVKYLTSVLIQASGVILFQVEYFQRIPVKPVEGQKGSCSPEGLQAG